MRFRLLGFLILVFAASSCVSNKKYVLMQKDDVNKEGLPVDSIVRKYFVEAPEYKIQPEDIVSVRFESLTPKDLDFLKQESSGVAANTGVPGGNALLIGELVDPNGEIPFPFIGKVKVSGLSVFEIQDKLQKIAQQYLDSPVVKVRLVNFRFTLLGEVKQEGTVLLANNKVTMLEAIGWAGGLTDLADKKNVKLIRKKDGVTSVQYINLLDENFINSPNYFIYQGDILIVPALKQRPYQTYFGKNMALLVSTLSLVILVITLARQ